MGSNDVVAFSGERTTADLLLPRSRESEHSAMAKDSAESLHSEERAVNEQTRLRRARQDEILEEWMSRTAADFGKRCEEFELRTQKEFERFSLELEQRQEQKIDKCDKRMNDIIRDCEQRLHHAIAEATEVHIAENKSIETMHQQLKKELEEHVHCMESTVLSHVHSIRDEWQQEKTKLTSLLEETTNQLEQQISVLVDHSDHKTFSAQLQSDNEVVARVSEPSSTDPKTQSTVKRPNVQLGIGNVDQLPKEEFEKSAKETNDGDKSIEEAPKHEMDGHGEKLCPVQGKEQHRREQMLHRMKQRVPHLLQSLEEQLREFFREMSTDNEKELSHPDSECRKEETVDNWSQDCVLRHPSSATRTKKPIEEGELLLLRGLGNVRADKRNRLRDCASRLLRARKNWIKQQRSLLTEDLLLSSRDLRMLCPDIMTTLHHKDRSLCSALWHHLETMAVQLHKEIRQFERLDEQFQLCR